MKLLVAVPSLDFMHVDFVRCLTNLIERLHEDGIAFETKLLSGTLVYVARNRLVDHAINNNFTHVLWLDADMVFKPDILDDLMFSGHDFVCGRFNARRKPYIACQFKKLVPIEVVEDYPAETFQIAGTGFGCVLTSVDILKKVAQLEGSCFLPTSGLGEDLAFCARCHDNGIKMYCEPTAVVGHIGHITIYPEDHARYIATISNYENCNKG